jgi:dolichyl-diphosphooligosaccharide--protein glycosyltransferase
MALTFYTPVIISALSVIPAFFITRRIAGNFAGFVAATIVAIHPSFLTRTVGGFADTDAYNVMFPLFIAWFFLEALEAKKFKNVIFLSAASGLFVGFYSMTWGGWWYIFDFILASTAFYVAYYAFVHKKELIRSFSGFVKQKAIKNSLTFLMVFFTVSALATTLFINYNHFSKFVKNPGGFAKLKEVGITTIWPNVFTTVAEQNPASLNNVVNQVGLGEFYIFMIALIGITLTLTGMHRRKMWFVLGTLAWYLTLLFLKDKPFIQDLNTFLILISIPIVIRVLIALWESDKEIDLKYAIFLVLWFLATTFASTKGIRFTLLLVPAFAIGLGISFGALLKYGRELISKNLKVNRLVTSALIIIILIMALGIIPVPASACGKIPGTHIWCNALNTARSELPSLNDAWRTSLERIKDDSKEDAIINSWWDFGHWFKFWADRAVTFDGTSQNTPQAHWIGKVLLTNNEKTAVGILRMLDCSGGATGGGTAAFGLISEKVNDGTETVSILNNIISKDKEGARKILKENFNDKEINVILEQTHCQPPENYFITSEDMVGKSGVWAHFGSWDFERGLIYNTLKKKEYSNNVQKSSEFLQERFGYSEKRAEDFYYEVQSITDSNQANSWIAPWPSYAGSTSCSRISNETFGCDISGIPLIFNPTTNEMYAESSTGKVYPHKVSIQTEEGVTLKQYDESTIPLGNGRQLGIALIKNGDSYSAVAMDSDLSGSMFTRMFYQEGAGLKHFKKFSDERAFIGGRIIVWKVDWEGKEIPIVQESTDPQNNTQQHQAME